MPASKSKANNRRVQKKGEQLEGRHTARRKQAMTIKEARTQPERKGETDRNDF